MNFMKGITYRWNPNNSKLTEEGSPPIQKGTYTFALTCKNVQDTKLAQDHYLPRSKTTMKIRGSSNMYQINIYTHKWIYYLSYFIVGLGCFEMNGIISKESNFSLYH